MSSEDLAAMLRAHRFHFADEAELQEGVAAVLTAAGVDFDREHRFGPRDRIDFLVGTVGLEVKVDGGPSALLRQLHRYAPYVAGLLVVTSLQRLRLAVPESIRGVPVAVVCV